MGDVTKSKRRTVPARCSNESFSRKKERDDPAARTGNSRGADVEPNDAATLVMGGIARLLSRLARHYPLYRGRGRLALSRFARPNTAAAPEPVLTTLVSGEQILVLPDDYISRMVLFFGDLDPAISAVLRRILRPGDTAIDVGANVGVVTLQMATLVGACGRVLAFEPVRSLHDLLVRSIDLNGIRNVTTFNCALSATDGAGRISIAPTNYGVGALTAGDEGESCEVRTFDRLAEHERIRRVRLMKIDVEGHEAEVFSGATTFLKTAPPDFVLFESHRRRGPFWKRREVELLANAGYEFQQIGRTAFGRPALSAVMRTDDTQPRAEDFLARWAGAPASKDD